MLIEGRGRPKRFSEHLAFGGHRQTFCRQHGYGRRRGNHPQYGILPVPMLVSTNEQRG